MKKINRVHAAKYALWNFECGKCSTGVVQVHKKWSRGGNLTTTVEGCLDCGHPYGLKQVESLNKYTRDDLIWP